MGHPGDKFFEGWKPLLTYPPAPEPVVTNGGDVMDHVVDWTKPKPCCLNCGADAMTGLVSECRETARAVPAKSTTMAPSMTDVVADVLGEIARKHARIATMERRDVPPVGKSPFQSICDDFDEIARRTAAVYF